MYILFTIKKTCDTRYDISYIVLCLRILINPFKIIMSNYIY